MAARKKPTNDEQPKQPTKATEAQVMERVTAMVAMSLDGYSRGEIIEYAAKKWDITASTVDEIYFPKVRERISQRAKEVIDTKFDVTLEMAFALYRAAKVKGDLKNANSALDKIIRLLGTYAPTKSELTGKDGAAIQVTDPRMPDFTGWTTEELLAWRKAQSGE